MGNWVVYCKLPGDRREHRGWHATEEGAADNARTLLTEYGNNPHVVPYAEWQRLKALSAPVG